MKNTLQRNWWLELLKGLVAIGLSIIVFMNPANALVAVATYIGALAIIGGIVLIILSLSRKRGWWQFTFSQGIIYSLIGLFIVVYPELSAGLLIFLIGLLIVIMGIMQLTAWISLREIMPSPPVNLLTAVISLLVGVLLLFNPFEGAVLATIIIAVYALLYGLTRLYQAWLLITGKDRNNIDIEVED
ncbi:MAG: DUF308 domain-containing protein [Bacteroidales bacterium]|jgi:uncharacterized membrane protein HdeD (DUF308 family)|nr:DUF308 domain-containing protein [Bacteroidales bacterium]